MIGAVLLWLWGPLITLLWYPSGAKTKSSDTYVRRDESASFLKQGYSHSVSGSMEGEWGKNGSLQLPRKHRTPGERLSSPTPICYDVQIQKSFGNWYSRARGTKPWPGELPGVGSPEWCCRSPCPPGLEELPRVLECLEACSFIP